MDERELEARLSRRLHARFDTGAAPAALHDRVTRSLTTTPASASAGWLARLTLPRQLVTVAAVIAVVALIALTLRFTQTPVPVTPGGSPTPSADLQLLRGTDGNASPDPHARSDGAARLHHRVDRPGHPGDQRARRPRST